MGLKHCRWVVRPDELVGSLKWLVDETGDGPALLEVVTERKANVPADGAGGGWLDEFITYDASECKSSRRMVEVVPMVYADDSFAQKGRGATTAHERAH